MSKPRSLKQSLFVNFTLAAVVPIVAVSVLVLYDLAGDILEDVAEKNLLLARAVSGKVEVFLREPQAALQGIRGMLRADPDMSADKVRQMLDTYVRTSGLFESIYILDRDGKVKSVGLPPAKAGFRDDFLGIDLAHLAFPKQARRSGNPTWSDTFLSVISGKMSLALALAVDERVLVGNFNIDILGDFVERIHGGERVVITIVDRGGAIIVHHDPVITARQVNVSHLSVIRSGLAGKEETKRYVFEDEEYLGSVSLIPGPGWVAVASQTTADAYRPVRYAGVLFVGGVIGAILLAMALALARANKLTRPLSEFVHHAKVVAGGEYGFSFTESGYLELKELGENFLSMAAAIRERENQLLESRERYRQLVENMNDGMGVLDRDDKMVYLNPRLGEMLGYSPEEMLGRDAENFFDEENKAVLREQLARRKRGEREIYELAWTRKDGSKLQTIVSPQPLFEEGSYKGSFAVFTDITALKHAEQACQQAQAQAEQAQAQAEQAQAQAEQARDKIDAILKSVADGLIVTDLEDRVILMNRAAEDLLGVSPDQAVSRPIGDIVADRTLPAAIAGVLARQASGSPVDWEIPGPDPGRPRTIQVRASLAKSKEARKIGVITLLRDVTREREIDRMKSEFISTVAHEFRTPLTSIQGFSHLLLTREEISTQEKKEFLTYIHERAVTLAAIVSDLLDIARIEAGKPLPLRREACMVQDIFRQVEPFLKNQAAGHRFEIDLAADSTRLDADKGKIGQVLENLLSNAIKYSSAGSLIRLRGEPVPAGYRICVVDQGIGMSEEQTARVFDKFYRGDASDTAVEGIGLGMSIARHIIEGHGGRIQVASEPGKGTTVSFTIPLAKGGSPFAAVGRSGPGAPARSPEEPKRKGRA